MAEIKKIVAAALGAGVLLTSCGPQEINKPGTGQPQIDSGPVGEKKFSQSTGSFLEDKSLEKMRVKNYNVFVASNLLPGSAVVLRELEKASQITEEKGLSFIFRQVDRDLGDVKAEGTLIVLSPEIWNALAPGFEVEKGKSVRLRILPGKVSDPVLEFPEGSIDYHQRYEDIKVSGTDKGKTRIWVMPFLLRAKGEGIEDGYYFLVHHRVAGDGEFVYYIRVEDLLPKTLLPIDDLDAATRSVVSRAEGLGFSGESGYEFGSGWGSVIR